MWRHCFGLWDKSGPGSRGSLKQRRLHLMPPTWLGSRGTLEFCVSIHFCLFVSISSLCENMFCVTPKLPIKVHFSYRTRKRRGIRRDVMKTCVGLASIPFSQICFSIGRENEMCTFVIVVNRETGKPCKMYNAIQFWLTAKGIVHSKISKTWITFFCERQKDHFWRVSLQLFYMQEHSTAHNKSINNCPYDSYSMLHFFWSCVFS